MSDDFYFGPDEGGTNWHGPCTSREDAIREAKAYDPDWDHVWVGRSEPYKVDTCDLADTVLDQLATRATDNSPDDVADFWPSATATDCQTLDARLKAVVDAWLDETCNHPTWFLIVECERVELPGKEDGK